MVMIILIMDLDLLASARLARALEENAPAAVFKL
jgi:hypothetical protein